MVAASKMKGPERRPGPGRPLDAAEREAHARLCIRASRQPGTVDGYAGHVAMLHCRGYGHDFDGLRGYILEQEKVLEPATIRKIICAANFRCKEDGLPPWTPEEIKYLNLLAAGQFNLSNGVPLQRGAVTLDLLERLITYTLATTKDEMLAFSVRLAFSIAARTGDMGRLRKENFSYDPLARSGS